ncbi:MAG: phenylalanine--tRNA ligase subunit beta [Thermoplasmatales archaeon]|nr:phenylalanine--tRNA ligase subunit beta [Thermoplasmatales archaeon]
MPLVTFDYNDFIDILGHHISKDELIEKLPMIGGDFDKIEGDELSIEFFPNRPDLTSVEGIARASRAFFGFETGLREYDVTKSDISITVDPSVKGVRPFVTTALIKNVTMTDELIASLMDMQEKLHFGLGRNRRKVAIGVHNFEPVIPPFTYKAVDPDSVQFIPLAKDEYMTLSEILEKHEKGVDYAYLLEGFDKYPLIVDANNNVLSFPPIINGSLTEVTPFTKEIFIDVTGTDRKSINYALNIVATALAERGSQIFSTTIYDEGKTYSSPDLSPIKKGLSVDYVNKILGTNLKEKEIMNCLEKMGYNSLEIDENKIEVEIPAWRPDILHEIDLVEDVAVGYGFDKFEIDFPRALTFGRTLPHHDLLDSLRSIMIGLGFNEVTTFTISNEKDEFTNMGLEIGKMVEIENPIGEEYSGLRTSLLPSLLKILRENRHHPLPQQIFELGIVVDEHAKNRRNLAGIKIDAKANFTESKSIIEAVLRDIGITYSITEGNHPAFIIGRCGSIVKDEKEIGLFGELHPRAIQMFELEHPIVAFELKTDFLSQVF